MTENEFRLAARIGLLELAFEEAGKLGLRFVLCRGGGTLSRAEARDLSPPSRPETLDGLLRDVQRLAKEFHDPAPDAMQRVVMAPMRRE